MFEEDELQETMNALTGIKTDPKIIQRVKEKLSEANEQLILNNAKRHSKEWGKT